MTTIEKLNDRLIITHTKGNTLAFSSTAQDDGVDIDFTGYTAVMSFKQNENAAAVLELETGAGITLSTGVISISATAAQMDIPSGAYYFDLKFTVGGVVTTWLEGVLNIKSSWQ